MNSPWTTALAATIAVVVGASVCIGLLSPDGSVSDVTSPAAATTVEPAKQPPTKQPPTRQPSTRPPKKPTAQAAPASVAGLWPGLPSGVLVDSRSVDWCPAVTAKSTAEARHMFDQDALDDAACAAVRFVFEHRYVRRALPRESYQAANFADVLPALTNATAATYRRRISQFIASPDGRGRGDALGLIMLRGDVVEGQVSAGDGRVFYGPAWSTTGYRNRAVWINPTWSTVAIAVDHGKSRPRLIAHFEASAAVPVFDRTSTSDQMMTIGTTASLVMRRDGNGPWQLGGWNLLATGARVFEPLRVNSPQAN